MSTIEALVILVRLEASHGPFFGGPTARRVDWQGLELVKNNLLARISTIGFRTLGMRYLQTIRKSVEYMHPIFWSLDALLPYLYLRAFYPVYLGSVWFSARNLGDAAAI